MVKDGKLCGEKDRCEEATVMRVEPYLRDGLVTFVGVFEGHEHTYDFQAPTEKSAEKLRELIGENVGKMYSSLGALELDGAP